MILGILFWACLLAAVGFCGALLAGEEYFINQEEKEFVSYGVMIPSVGMIFFGFVGYQTVAPYWKVGIIAGGIMLLIGFFAYLWAQKEEDKQVLERQRPTQYRVSEGYDMGVRKVQSENQWLERAEHEVRFDGREDGGVVQIRSSRPMRRVQIYIRNGEQVRFAYKIDEYDE